MFCVRTPCPRLTPLTHLPVYSCFAWPTGRRIVEDLDLDSSDFDSDYLAIVSGTMLGTYARLAVPRGQLLFVCGVCRGIPCMPVYKYAMCASCMDGAGP
jgi:hypothetical protein